MFFVIVKNEGLRPGLPDFSWSKITKTGENIPNGHKICPMAVK
jgi:hypothetical protein